MDVFVVDSGEARLAGPGQPCRYRSRDSRRIEGRIFDSSFERAKPAELFGDGGKSRVSLRVECGRLTTLAGTLMSTRKLTRKKPTDLTRTVRRPMAVPRLSRVRKSLKLEVPPDCDASLILKQVRHD